MKETQKSTEVDLRHPDHDYREANARENRLVNTSRAILWIVVAVVFLVSAQGRKALPVDFSWIVSMLFITAGIPLARYLLDQKCSPHPGLNQLWQSLMELMEALSVLLIMAIAISGTIIVIHPNLQLLVVMVAIALGWRITPPTARREDNSKLDEHQVRYQAVHEAGHALALALTDRSHLEGAYVVLGAGHDLTTYTNVLFDRKKESFAYYKQFQMLFFLAGPVATEMYYEQPTDGAMGDMDAWKSRASGYFDAIREPKWNNNPESGDEVDTNIEMLEELQEYHERLLQKFFKDNADPYLQLVDYLIAHRQADSGTLADVLKKVVVSEELLELTRSSGTNIE